MPAPPAVEPPASSDARASRIVGLAVAGGRGEHEARAARVDHDRHAVLLAQALDERAPSPPSAAAACSGRPSSPRRRAGRRGAAGARSLRRGSARAGRRAPGGARASRGRRATSVVTEKGVSPAGLGVVVAEVVDQLLDADRVLRRQLAPGRGSGARWRRRRCRRRSRRSTAGCSRRPGTGCPGSGRRPPCGSRRARGRSRARASSSARTDPRPWHRGLGRQAADQAADDATRDPAGDPAEDEQGLVLRLVDGAPGRAATGSPAGGRGPRRVRGRAA